MKENKTIEILFDRFVNTTPKGELAEAMRKLSAELDAAIEAGDTDKATELTADHELAASRLGFYAGFLAGLELGRALQQATA